MSQIPESLQLDDLTIDKRHLKSKKIKLKTYEEICDFQILHEIIASYNPLHFKKVSRI